MTYPLRFSEMQERQALLVMKTGCHYSTPDWTVIMPRANSVFWLARFCPRQIDSCFNLNCRSLRRIHEERNNSVVRAFRIWISLVAFRAQLLANSLSELFVLRNKLEVNDNYQCSEYSHKVKFKLILNRSDHVNVVKLKRFCLNSLYAFKSYYNLTGIKLE